jgi:hypothetical protein
MRYKATFAIGLGAGYVLGTKAGRQRYEQIKRTARGLRDNPTVQETAGVVQAQAVDLLSTAKDKAADAISHSKVGDKLAHTKVGERLGAGGAPAGSPNGSIASNTP